MGVTNERAAMPPPPARRRRSSPRKVRSRPFGSANSTPRDSKHASSTNTSFASLLSSSLATPRACSTTSFPTSAVTFHSSHHGRMRRCQRNIGKRQLQAAFRHGIRRPSGVPGRSKYIYNGITFVVDDATKQEVTSYSTPFDIPYKDISRAEWDLHVRAREAMHRDAPTHCQSHSVLLVDVSGSMRNSDVQGSRTRLAAVWFAIAEDFIKNRIDSGQAGEKDAISIVLMGETASLHPYLHNVPTDWVTYNAVLEIYKQGRITPRGHGCFRPALSLAERILGRYTSSECALVLAVLSDGRPSDSKFLKTSFEEASKLITESVASLSSRLGKRLTVSTVGMGSANQFETLQQMTDEVKGYGSTGLFVLPSMSSSSIGAAISSIATSLTTTQTQMAVDNRSNDRKRLIRDVVREDTMRIPAFTEVVDPKDFFIYMDEKVVHKVYDPKLEGPDPFNAVPLQHPEACGVAIAKKAFGEGTERFAFQFFEVAKDGRTVVGEPLVAKQSRYVMEGQKAEEEINKFVRRFCRIHHQAAKAAAAFNSKLDSIKTLDSDTARVSFVPCSVYQLTDPDNGVFSVTVEKRLFGKFVKWNSNNGWKKSRRRSSSAPNPLLGAIPEEAISMDDDRDTTNIINLEMEEAAIETVFVTQDEVAQAFSHYSYIFGGRKSLICDLQGVFDRQQRLLCFTDPVVHYHDVLREDKRGQYGRTDRGEKGIHDFLHSHECNCLCDIATKGFLTVPSAKRSA